MGTTVESHLAATTAQTSKPSVMLGALKRWLSFAGWGFEYVHSEAAREVAPAAEEIPQSHQPSLNIESDEPPAWCDLAGTDCAAHWAREIAAAMRGDSDALPWELVGPHAILEVDDLERGRHILHRASLEAGLRFTIIDADAVHILDLAKGDPFAACAPALVYLEPGAWMFPNDSADATPEVASRISTFRTQLRDYLGRIDWRNPVVFATLAKDVDHVAAPLRSVRFFPRRMVIRALTPEEAGEAFLKELGADCCGASLRDNLAGVGRVVKDHDSARVRDLHIFALRRIAKREARRVEWTDLMEIAIRGTLEGDLQASTDMDYLNLVATHEAGHAVIAMLDSAGANTPEYLSIVPSHRFEGVSLDSVSYHWARQDRMRYADLRHRVRTGLAGRAAEEVVYGAEHVSGGAAEDLKKATQVAAHAFAILGFAPGMEEEGESASNLAVVVGEPSDSECAHIEGLVRAFLATEYCAVRTMLQANRALLDETVRCLLERKVMRQDELRDIVDRHLLTEA